MVDPDRSIDKRKVLDPDRFGYLSLHYICKLRPERLKLVEYRRFDGLLVEIQVRSILQHAWAEIEHDLGYKTPAAIPQPIRRRFSRLAGLLEVADTEFIHIRNELEAYSAQVKKEIAQPGQQTSLLVDKVSLKAFVEADSDWLALEEALASTVKLKVVSPPAVPDAIVEKLRNVGLNTIEEIRSVVAENQDHLLKQWRLFAAEIKQPGKLHFGFGLYQIYYLMLGKAGGSDALQAEFNKHGVGKKAKRADLAKQIGVD